MGDATNDLPELSRLQAGDKEAWEKLRAVGYGFVRKSGWFLTESEIEDVVSDGYATFQSIVQQGRVKHEKNLCAYFKQIVFHHLMRERRRIRRAPLSLDALVEDGSELPDPKKEGIEPSEMGEVRQLLETFRQSFKDIEWQIVRDFYCEGMKYREIAANYGIPIGRICSTLSRAKAKFVDVRKYNPKIAEELRLFLAITDGK